MIKEDVCVVGVLGFGGKLMKLGLNNPQLDLVM